MEEGNNDYIVQLRLKAQEKVEEYATFVHEKQRIDMLLARNEAYREQLNRFIDFLNKEEKR